MQWSASLRQSFCKFECPFTNKEENQLCPFGANFYSTFSDFALAVLYARAPEKIRKGAGRIKKAHRCSLHSVPLAPSCISKPTSRTFQGHTKQNQRIISCFPAGNGMRKDWKQKRKQAPEPDGGGACVWILNLSLWSSVNTLYHSNIEKNISQYVTMNCNFYKCTFRKAWQFMPMQPML